MTTDILVPALGESVSEATVAQWLKQPGDPIAVDEPLVELETDKVTLEINATGAGVLGEVLAEEGENVEVGAVLGRITAASAGAEASVKPATAPVSQAVPQVAPESTPDSEAAPAAAPPTAPSSATPSTNGGRAQDIVVPALGESVTEATVAKWMKQVGEAVAADEALVELETDKVTLEVNAPEAGVLSAVNVQEGDTVEVAAVLGTLSLGGAAAAAASVVPGKAPTPVAPTPSVPAPSATTSALVAGPAAALDPAKALRSGPGGRITKSDVIRFLQQDVGAAAGVLSPAVRKIVDDNRLDPRQILGTGKDGRITKEDVLKVLAAGPAPAAPTISAPAAPAAPAAPQAAGRAAPREERVAMTRMRKRIAERLKQAQDTAAMLTTFNEADMTAVMALRAQYREKFEKKHGVKLGFMSFFTKAVIAVLKELPAVNAEIDGDDIVYKHHYDIGMAVGTPQGLVVPVLRDADLMSFADIERTIGDLGRKARDGKLSLDEMTGGTFTITNGGVYGSLMSTPILNPPQSGILGLHKIQERPVAVDGAVQIRPMMYLALSYDHRIIDGREAVTFLVRLKECIEDPRRLLLDM